MESNLPAIRSSLPARPRGFLSRFLTSEDKALQGIEAETTREIARIKAEGEIQKHALREEAEQELFAYQLTSALELEKHRTDLKVRNAKILATVGADFNLDVKLDEFTQGIEELGLDVIDEIQHQQKAKRTARREKSRHRMNQS